MVLTINIVIFGYIVFTDVHLLERNVAYSIIIFGFVLKLLITNINARSDETPFLDIFFGAGFSAIFKGKFSYFINPIKQLFTLNGPIFSFGIILLAAFFFPLVGPQIIDLATFRSFIFMALTTGYSADLIVQQFRHQFSTVLKSTRLIKEVIDIILEEESK